MPFRPTHPEYEPRLAFDNSHSPPGSTAREPARNRGSGRGCERSGSRHSHLSVILAEPHHFRQPPTVFLERAISIGSSF